MPKIHIIAGPTASGKSARALALAEKLGGVVINADSQQLFADLPILTARPTPEETSRAPHKLYGILAADEAPSAGKWLRMAKMEIDWARGEGRTPIVVGGTGMYIKALIAGIAEIPDIDERVRAQAENDYTAMGKAAFEARLREVDPAFFERLKTYDRQRLVRAYSVWLGSGKSLSFWQQQGSKPAYPHEDFEIEIMMPERDELYRRCDLRFDQMIEAGAVQEVKEWWSGGVVASAGNHTPLPHHPTTPLLKIIGAREILAHLQGELTLDEAIEKSKQMTRNYAKRQRTWFAHQL